MRISDWSSDVCSSDLLLHLAVLDSGTITGPEGWTNVRSPSSVNIFTAKIANGTEGGTSATINKTSTSTTAASQIIRVSNWSGNLADIENVASSTLTNTAIFNQPRSEEHTSELQSLMRISYAVFCLKKKKKQQYTLEHKT